jgi:hypothetical protein
MPAAWNLGQIKSIADPRHPPASITGCVARLAPPETGVLRVTTRNKHRAVLAGRGEDPRPRQRSADNEIRSRMTTAIRCQNWLFCDLTDGEPAIRR